MLSEHRRDITCRSKYFKRINYLAGVSRVVDFKLRGFKEPSEKTCHLNLENSNMESVQSDEIPILSASGSAEVQQNERVVENLVKVHCLVHSHCFQDTQDFPFLITSSFSF